MSQTTSARAVDVDPFSEEFLVDPYPFHEVFREAGPAVRIERYPTWVLARYDPIQCALNDPETYSSAAGVGLSDFRREKPWRKPSLLLETDRPEHTKARAAIMRSLTPRVMEGLRVAFAENADRLIDGLVRRRSFDAVPDLATAYPVETVADAIGLSKEGREHLVTYGHALFNSFGPANRVAEETLGRAGAAIAWVAESCRRESLSPDGLGALVYTAADDGKVSEEEAGLLVRSFLSAGIVTTVHSLSSALYLFALHPEQWSALRRDPAKVRPAFEEILRLESPIQSFFRTTTRQTTLDEVIIEEGEKVLLLMGSANRDPRRWVDPDRFDIDRPPGGHMGFGGGLHSCVGAILARLEAHILLADLARKVESIELSGKPVRLINNILRGFDSLPVTLHPASN
ncbi:MAG: cytochrome P450 [Acidimicrobiia bacterium]